MVWCYPADDSFKKGHSKVFPSSQPFLVILSSASAPLLSYHFLFHIFGHIFQPVIARLPSYPRLWLSQAGDLLLLSYSGPYILPFIVRSVKALLPSHCSESMPGLAARTFICQSKVRIVICVMIRFEAMTWMPLGPPISI